MTSRRLLVIQWFFLIWFIVILTRLIYWQVIKSKELQEDASNQHLATLILPAPRGQILASDGLPLVGNQDNYLLYVNPKKLPTDISSLLSITDLLPSTQSSQLLLQAKSSNLSWVSISRSVTPSTKKLIEVLKIPGVGFESQPIRFYPEGTSSAYITGFVGRDDNNLPKGYFGLEGYYDRQLSGIPGKLISEMDAFGLPIVIGSTLRLSPREGDTIKTSIDRTVQFIAYDTLSKGLEKYQASSGTVTIMESKTGRILAMTSIPGYDPSNYSQSDPKIYKNPIISDGYEPGSTFKTLIMTAGLDAGVVTPETVCTSCNGPTVIADKVVRNWDNKYFPSSTMKDVILHSDNVGMVFVAKKLGKQKMYQYLKSFGLGELTNIDLQEEASPTLRPAADWYDIDQATIAFGQGVAVTPLQMTTAVNTIANRGVKVEPHIITEIITEKGKKTSIKPSTSFQVVSTQAAIKMTEMMTYAVNNGAVKTYKPDGYLIAGKTGTAQVAIEGHYDKDKVIASFVGFAPADNPKFTMLVTLASPKSSPWGSTTAAPLWFSIATELFRYYRIPKL